jgi:biopolymer transport protein TolQ
MAIGAPAAAVGAGAAASGGFAGAERPGGSGKGSGAAPLRPKGAPPASGRPAGPRSPADRQRLTFTHTPFYARWAMTALPVALFPVLASAPGSGKELDLFQLVLSSGGVVLLVLFLLIAFFVVTTFVIGYKLFQLLRAAQETDQFLDDFWRTKRFDEVYEKAKALRRSPVAAIFRAGYLELMRLTKQAGGVTEGGSESNLENIERSLRRSTIAEMTLLESLTPLLATVGSSAPFIGLFGTVWGIMDAFRNIGSKGSANLATVAPGIAEALIATAIGLVAAIPAVMAYNFFARKIKVLANEMDSFGNDFLNLVKRNYLR